MRFLVTSFLLALAVLGLTTPVAWALLAVSCAMSAATFLAYRADKRAAQRGRRRTEENALHLMSLLGGWPGASAAQVRYRHKTSKRSFQVVYRITVAANVFGYLWLIAIATS